MGLQMVRNTELLKIGSAVAAAVTATSAVVVVVTVAAAGKEEDGPEVQSAIAVALIGAETVAAAGKEESVVEMAVAVVETEIEPEKNQISAAPMEQLSRHLAETVA